MMPPHSVIVMNRLDEHKVMLFSFSKGIYATVFNWLVNNSTEYQSYRP